MAIEAEDLQLIRHLREENGTGSTCAILGDCNIYGYDLEAFALMMNFEKVDTFDINGNPTHKINLNEELPEKFKNQYDWVIDSGTLYCCFDVSTALKNILYMLKNEGCVLHTAIILIFYVWRPRLELIDRGWIFRRMKHTYRVFRVLTRLDFRILLPNIFHISLMIQ